MLTRRERRIVRINNRQTTPPSRQVGQSYVQDVSELASKKVSVCITAYNTASYIEECLDSVANQTWFSFTDNYDILLGIDGCEKTLEKVKSIMHKYKNLRVFFSENNVGTYIMTNTLMSMSDADFLIRFDSDDVMCPKMVETLVKQIKGNDIVRFRLQNFPIRTIEVTYGQIIMTKECFEHYGGYMPWRCEADANLLTRVGVNGKVKKIPDILFRRRVHSEALTRKKDTGYRSAERRNNKEYTRLNATKKPVIEMVTTGVIEIK